MQQNKNWLRKSIVGAGAIGLLLSGSTAGAATRGMVGALGVQNPSVAAPFHFEGGPSVAGRKIGNYPPTKGFENVQVAGAETGMTFVGRPITLMAGQLNFAGGRHRGFPSFPTVAQTTKTFMDVQQAATFMNGGGALAACPGPGCNSNGAGTAISFCPPLEPQPVESRPGNRRQQGRQLGLQRLQRPGRRQSQQATRHQQLGRRSALRRDLQRAAQPDLERLARAAAAVGTGRTGRAGRALLDGAHEQGLDRRSPELRVHAQLRQQRPPDPRPPQRHGQGRSDLRMRQHRRAPSASARHSRASPTRAARTSRSSVPATTAEPIRASTIRARAGASR